MKDLKLLDQGPPRLMGKLGNNEHRFKGVVISAAHVVPNALAM
jgi:hypothetical protein